LCFFVRIYEHHASNLETSVLRALRQTWLLGSRVILVRLSEAIDHTEKSALRTQSSTLTSQASITTHRFLGCCFLWVMTRDFYNASTDKDTNHRPIVEVQTKPATAIIFYNVIIQKNFYFNLSSPLCHPGRWLLFPTYWNSYFIHWQWKLFESGMHSHLKAGKQANDLFISNEQIIISY
jgi:hypothetical protein